MPNQPFRACPRCGGKFRGPSCPACSVPRASSPRAFRGQYGRRWTKQSLDFRARFPFCGLRNDNGFHPDDSDCVRLGRKVLATLVDHIRPVQLGGDMWDERNYQSLCSACHARKSARETGRPHNDRRTTVATRRRYVVTGPPGSGKTTFVDENRRPGDLVWDLDVLAAAIAQVPDYPRPPLVLDVLSTLRTAFVRFLVERPSVPCFVIVADENEGIRLATLLGATLQRCRTPVQSSPALSAP